VPRRPGGGEPPADSVEAALRHVVVGTGPTAQKLVQDQSPGVLALMRRTGTPPHWSAEHKAAALLELLHELIAKIDNPRWKAAAQAAFRLPPEHYQGPEFDSIAGRWRGLARTDSGTDDTTDESIDKYRGHWTTAAARLADAFEQQFAALCQSGGWARFDKPDPHSPPSALPISFDRTDVLYRFQGQRGLQSLSYRWLTAHGDVDHYEAVGWYYNEPESPVDIVPLANCTLDGPLAELPQGGRSGRLKFSRRLRAGEKYFFAYTIYFNSQLRCRPTILYEVRGLSMRALTVRAQFDPAARPRMCWYFDVGVQVEGSRTPDPTAPEVLEVAPNGYTDHEFQSCERGRKYGLRWIWDEEDRPLDRGGGDPRHG